MSASMRRWLSGSRSRSRSSRVPGSRRSAPRRRPSRRSRRPRRRRAAPSATPRRRSRSTASARPTRSSTFGRTIPNWFDVNRPSKLPAFADEFGAQRHFLSERAAEPLRRRKAVSRRQRTATSPPSSSSTCSASAPTRARRRFACATPTASGASSARARRQPVHGRATCSRTFSSTGARTACCSSGTSRCSGDRSRRTTHATHLRARAPGRERRRRRLRRPRRAPERQAALPGARPHRPRSDSARTGATSSSRGIVR